MGSKDIFSENLNFLPKVVNSPVKYFDPYMFFTNYAKGLKLYVVDNKKIIDYWMAYKSLILGHASDFVGALSDPLFNETVYEKRTLCIETVKELSFFKLNSEVADIHTINRILSKLKEGS